MGIREQIESEDQGRTVHVFTVPEKLQHLGTREVGLVELKVSEERRAAKRTKGDQAGLAYELVKSCLVMIDGRRVMMADGSVDKEFAALHPRIRALVMQAYVKVHQPEDEESEDFLKSQRTGA